MKARRIVVVAAVLCMATVGQGKNRLEFQGMTATYSGEGRVLLGRMAGDFMYTLIITGSTNAEAKAGTLTIAPREKGARNRVFIDTIYSMTELSGIRVTMPPGREHACYVRNIYVRGDVGRIDIVGGDLGASDMRDGQVVIAGALGEVRVQGRSYVLGGSNEWWGGNIWADIYANGNMKGITVYGGSVYYHPFSDMVGTIDINGNLDRLVVQSYVDKRAGRIQGGAMRGHVVVNNGVLKQWTVLGGRVEGVALECLRVEKLSLRGQKVGGPQPGYGEGMFRSYVEAADVGGDGQYSELKSVTVQDAVIRDSLFGIKGDIKAVKVTASADQVGPAVSNVVMRAGYAGDLAKGNKAPELAPSSVVTNVYGGNTIVVPFLVKGGNTGDVLGVRLHFRDRAIKAFLSNHVGQVFYGSSTWIVTSYPVTGMFVWSTTVDDNGWCSNIIIRVHNHGTPYRYYDMYIVANVSTTVVPVTLVLTPSANPRTFNKDVEPFLDWVLTVANPWQHGAITYGLSGPAAVQLGLQVTNLDSQTGYAFTTKPLSAIPVGVYSNLIFSADNGTYRDEKNVTLIVVTGGAMRVQIGEARGAGREERRGQEQVAAREGWVNEGDIPFQWEGAFNRDIGKVSVVGDVRDSMFVAGTADVPANDWANADYLGRLGSVKISGAAVSNTFVSVRKISFGKLFDYVRNFVWVNGERQLGP
ncbi:MAG: hypothetical protein N2595_03390 [bacterium]|nr:hypothetical protein [bacterium]